MLPHEDILTFDEIVKVVEEAVKLGVDKVRLTGGEPLVRKDISLLVKMIAEIKGIRDFSMTTNGVLLKKFAKELVLAGLQRVNISLDTINAEIFRKITRGGNLQEVLEGIEAAREAGLHPIKINCVVKHSSDEPLAKEVKSFCEMNGLHVRFIREMNLETGAFGQVEGGDGGHCHRCNRIRLTADGKIMPCLFSDIGFHVREFGAREAILLAVCSKPKAGTINHVSSFHVIGG